MPSEPPTAPEEPAQEIVGPSQIDGTDNFSKTTSIIASAILCIIAAAAIATVFLLAPNAEEAAKNDKPSKDQQFPEFAKVANGKYFCNLLAPRMDEAIVEIDDNRLLTGNSEELSASTITSVKSEETAVGDIGPYAELFPQATDQVINFTIKAIVNSTDPEATPTESEFQIMAFRTRMPSDRRAMIFGASVQGWGMFSYACQTEASIDQAALEAFNEWYWGTD